MHCVHCVQWIVNGEALLTVELYGSIETWLAERPVQELVEGVIKQ
jgi:hypothetical protein